MEKLIEKIWSFGLLTEQERQELEAQVADNAEYRSLLDDSKAVHALLREAGVFARDTDDEIALAYLVAHNQVTSGEAPDILEKAYKQLQHKIEAMPKAKERYMQVRVRMEEIAMMSDPIAQFEQLTGYSTEQDFDEVNGPRDFKKQHYAGDRSSVKSQGVQRVIRSRTWSRLVLAGCVVLFSLGYYFNRIDRNAFTPADVLLVHEIVEERGLDEFQKPVSPDVVFMFAQRAVYESQHVWLGMFYTYDQERLVGAEELLDRVRQDSLSSSFLLEESTYLLAKVHLAQKDFSRAALLLDELIILRGRRLEEAKELKALL